MRTQRVVEDIQQSYTFTEWLETHQSSTTRSIYHAAVGKFLKSVYQTPQSTEALATRYIKEVNAHKRDVVRDLADFVSFTQDPDRNGKVMPPNSLELYLAATYGFLADCCGTTVSSRVKRSIRNRGPKGSHARTIEDDLTREKIRKILLHCDVRMKALVHFLVSSGVRVGEALQLKLDDVDIEASPVVVHVRGEYAKEGDSYTSFISSEAKEALQAWLRVRMEYITDNVYRSTHAQNRQYRPWRRQAKPASETNMFPFSYPSADLAFKNALKAAGLYQKDKTTGISTIHLHMFRKFFLSQSKTKIPSEVAEAMVGHAGYLSDAYRRYNTQQLAEFYRKAESALLIFQDTKPLEELDQRNKQFDEIVRHNQSLSAELANLKADQQKLTAYIMNVIGTSMGVKLKDLDIFSTDKAEFTVAEQGELQVAEMPKSKRASE